MKLPLIPMIATNMKTPLTDWNILFMKSIPGNVVSITNRSINLFVLAVQQMEQKGIMSPAEAALIGLFRVPDVAIC